MLNSFQFLSFMTSIYLLIFKLEVLFAKNDCLWYRLVNKTDINLKWGQLSLDFIII